MFPFGLRVDVAGESWLSAASSRGSAWYGAGACAEMSNCPLLGSHGLSRERLDRCHWALTQYPF